MAKIPRVTLKQFGQNALSTQLGVFGSLAAGLPTTGGTATTIQSLANWLGGWFSAILGSNNPAIEDMNGFCFLICYQLCYLMQEGVAEYDAGTTYYIGSIVSSAGVQYMSLVDNNIGFALINNAKWTVYGSGVRTVVANDTATLTDQYIRGNTTAGTFTQTLPLISATPLGTIINLKNVGTSGNDWTIAGNGTDKIDGAATLTLGSTPTLESARVFNNGTSWDIV